MSLDERAGVSEEEEAAEALESRILDLRESDALRFDLELACMCDGRMRLAVTELVMLVMLSREPRSCAGLARGVARLLSFSSSGVACLDDGFAMMGMEVLDVASLQIASRAPYL